MIRIIQSTTNRLTKRGSIQLSCRFSNLQETEDGFRFQDAISLLHHLGVAKDLKHGQSLHSLCIKTDFLRDVFVQNNLVRFYSVCNDLVCAGKLLDEMPEPNLVSWTTMVSAYVTNNQFENGLRVFSMMFRSGFRANEFGFSVALKACRVLRDFDMGMVIHGQILKCGFESCDFCDTSILGLYAECGDIAMARRAFDGVSIRERSEASWNTLLNGYVEISDVDGAVGLFGQMMQCDIAPNSFTFSTLVKLCANMLRFDLAGVFHGRIIKAGVETDLVVGGALVDAYVKTGFLDDACKVFESVEEKDNLVWSALLAGFHQSESSYEGLKFYLKFLSEGNKPDPFIYSSVFSLCSHEESATVGIQVHCLFIKDGFLIDSFLGSALIDMYGSLGMVSDSYKCFLEVRWKNEVCFGSMINNLLLHSYEETALELFSGMMSLGLVQNLFTVSYALRACGNNKMVREGKSVHSYIIKRFPDTDSNLTTENALIEMYAKLGKVDDMKRVFKGMKTQNEFSWTAVISGCSEIGLFEEALSLFQGIFLSPESIKPSEFTMVTVIHVCARLMALEKGKQSHCYATKVGFDRNPFVQSALISMYATFKHEINNAFLVFSSMKEPDLVSWSTMVTACTQNGHNEQALKLFSEFRSSPNFIADGSILSSCLSACAGSAALQMGKRLHAYITRTGHLAHIHVTSSVIDMYSKCGNIKDARKFFDEMENTNVVCWTAMMSGYAYNGLGKEAIEVFKDMKIAGLKPDGVAFIGILTACSHAGLVNEGWQFFKSIRNDYGLELSVNHYACMVDLLGRAEQVDEAEAFIKAAPLDAKPKSLLWKTLLGSCNKYGNIELGRRIGQMAVGLGPNDPSNYVLLSNIYATAEMWVNSLETRNNMRGRHVNKKPGYSWIQVES